MTTQRKFIVRAARIIPMLLVVSLAFCLSVGFYSNTASAADPPARTCGVGESPDYSQTSPCVVKDSAATDQTCKNGDCLVDKYVKPAIQALSALVGIVATGSIIYAGIVYSSSRDEAAKVQAAKTRIGQTIVALIAWILMLTFLQWVIPGGLF